MRYPLGVVFFAVAVILQPLAFFAGVWLVELVAGVLLVVGIRLMGEEN